MSFSGNKHTEIRWTALSLDTPEHKHTANHFKTTFYSYKLKH